MKQIILFIAFLLCVQNLSFAQKKLQPYFQQNVNYHIQVQLDDKKHTLSGDIQLDYTNHSDDELKKIAFHLWPNAYKNKNTAFFEQQINLGNVAIMQTPTQQLGYIDSLHFEANGKSLRMDPDPKHIDIAWVRLKSPLKPGETIRIETSFFVKIPNSLSRLGRVGESYQITQWYPKPAVYDHLGWHTMPYLDQGEFFSEFGNFHVRLTLPENYIVAATGTLETESEKEFIAKRIEETQNLPVDNRIEKDTFPTSSKQMKTIEFTAENVHDFAWFADKRFRVNKSSVKLESGNTVETYAYYTKEQSEMWQRATDYLDRSVLFYSKTVGDYPYPHATAVQAPRSKGAGMEYPMITLIGLADSPLDLDDVITHEVGHNWFYGILGSNERDFAWMDEGVNSFYEYKYLEEHYQQDGLPFMPRFLKEKGNLRDVSLIIIDRQSQKKLMPPSTPVDWQDRTSYTLNAYEYPAISFRMLEEYMGEESFSRAMKKYFSVWKFKHPSPQSMQSIFEAECTCNLDWLYKEMLVYGNSIDYKIKKGDRPETVKLENKGDVNAPIELIGFDGKKDVWRQWIDGFEGEQEVEFSHSLNGLTHIAVYDTTYTLDVSPNNNYLGGKYLKSGPPLKINFLLGARNSTQNSLYVSPMLMYNDYDKGMIGGWIHNASIPGKGFRFSIMPMYSFESKDLAGVGELRLNIYPKKGSIKRVSTRLNLRKFSYNLDDHYEFVDRYSKIEPEVVLTFRPKSLKRKIETKLSYRLALINQKHGVGLDFESKSFLFKKRSYYVNEIAFSHERKYALAPSYSKVTFQQGQGFMKLQGSYHQQLTYDKPSRGLFFHLFGGVFLQNENTDAAVNFLFNGTTGSNIFAKDYMHDEYLIGRNASEGILSQQIFHRDAELKTLTNIGISNKTMFGAGISSNLPIPLPIHFYADLAIYSDPFSSELNVSYSSGFALIVRKNFIEVYFPVFESQDIRESLTYEQRSKYLEKVSFIFNLKGFRPLQNTEDYFEFLY